MSTESGQSAEAAAASWLEAGGFKILARNWRNRWCEIDIVASKQGTVHIVEVKYRKSADYGSGFEYITGDKQRRLRKAASMWLADQGAEQPHQIDVISITPKNGAMEVSYLPNAIEE